MLVYGRVNSSAFPSFSHSLIKSERLLLFSSTKKSERSLAFDSSVQNCLGGVSYICQLHTWIYLYLPVVRESLCFRTVWRKNRFCSHFNDSRAISDEHSLPGYLVTPLRPAKGFCFTVPFFCIEQPGFYRKSILLIEFQLVFFIRLFFQYCQSLSLIKSPGFKEEGRTGILFAVILRQGFCSPEACCI